MHPFEGVPLSFCIPLFLEYLESTYGEAVRTIVSFCIGAVLFGLAVGIPICRNRRKQRRTASGQMDLLEHQMQAVLEAYPNLRSSETVCALQKSCAEAEAYLQAARRLYNAGVTNYNNFCKAFPSSILATVLGHREAAYFQADPEKWEDIEF